MMKNIVSSPWRKLKIFLILPVFAIVLYAFAKPEYSYNSVKGSPETKNPALTIQDQVVKGTVVQEDGTPLPGASVVVKGTTLGTTTDLNGSFVLDKLPSDAELIVSFIGFQSKIIKAGKNSSEMKITMNRRIVNIEEVKIVPPPPPPPPPLPGSNEKVSKVEEKKSTDKVAFIVVEEMPSFPGGYTALSEWISSNMKYPAEAAKNNISGQVSVDFIVTWQGKIKDVRVNQPGNPLLDAEAVRVISNMPAWNPGKQGGKQVPVNMRIPINFSNEKIPVNTNHK
jgi:TonB family protein